MNEHTEKDHICKPNHIDTSIDLTGTREEGAAAKPTTNDKRCIILLGKNGNGKSSLGNYLLGTKKFKTSLVEQNRTKSCQIELTDNLVVMDTPGFFTMLRSDVDVAKEIIDAVRANKLLIHVYILVLSADERLLGDEKESMELIKKLFGEHVINSMIIVFTGKDTLEDNEFQFPSCLPQLPYYILDCKHKKQEDAEEIRKEIFSQKYENSSGETDVDHVDLAAIEKEEISRKNSHKINVDGYVNAVQSTLGLTQSDGKSTPKETNSSSKEIRAAILGKTGTGKSSLGNSLLGMKIFKYSRSASSVSQQCELGDAETSIGKLLVVDTPGLFDTDKPNEETTKELIKCIALLAPGPHVFILVLSVDRFTRGDIETVEILKQMLGEGTMHHIIVVFTRKDHFESDDTTTCLEEFIATIPEFLGTLLRDVNCRYEFICNRQENSNHQQDVVKVLSLIKKTVEQNDFRFYTQDMFEATEKMIQQEIRECQKKWEKSEEECRQDIKDGITKNDPGIISKIIQGVSDFVKDNHLLVPNWLTAIMSKFEKK